MKLRLHFLIITILIFGKLQAHEGMWIPSLLYAVENEMQAEGLSLTAEDIYSINNSSLKDAIVHFGGGCTAEVISDEALILTNYHCGYSQIQSHSSVEKDYLTDGFWATNKAGELVNPGLTATFIVRIQDVTDQVMEALSKASDMETRAKILQDIAKKLEQEGTENTNYKAKVVAFNFGAEYYMIVTNTFKDVRLVGAPPSSIGKFGGDTDNWIWPRHTGDFSLFRIYADSDNKPADYAESNRPYKPLKSLQISAAGVQKGDFTMVYGFPGSTSKYLVSTAVDYIQNVENPAKIAMREATLGIMESSMDKDEKIRIQYAAKQSRVSNAWKKWIGQNFGLIQQKVLRKKLSSEKEIQSLISKDADLTANYGHVIEELKVLNEKIEPYKMARAMFIEYVFYGPELIRFANKFDDIILHYGELEEAGKLEEEKEKLLRATDSFFKNFHQPTDKLIFDKSTEMYVGNVQQDLLPLSLRDEKARAKLSNGLYVKSIFSNKDKVKKMLNKLSKSKANKLKSDPAFAFAEEIYTAYFVVIRPEYQLLGTNIASLMKDYVTVQKIIYPEKKFSPNANSTLRLTYGKVEGSRPRDGVIYKYYTTAQGILDKYDPDSKDFNLPERLVKLLESKDYGRYGENGQLNVCFTGSNHTSGGNSGSPALNGKGQLVGLNFDRSWESTMSDIMFAPDICRNIMVDIRYVLFVIDKFAGAGYLVEEMDVQY